MPDTIYVTYVFEDEPSAEEYRKMFERFEELDISKKGETYHSVFWDKEEEMHPGYRKLDEVAEMLSASDTQSCIAFFKSDDLEFNVGYDDIHEYLNGIPFIDITTMRYRYKRVDDSDRISAAVMERIQLFIDVLEIVTEEMNPSYGYGAAYDDVSNEYPISEEVVEGDEVEVLFNYNIFSESAVEYLGREKVFSCPADYISELETGHVLLIVNYPPNIDKEDMETAAEHLGIPTYIEEYRM